jgi:hypothetical protein
MELCAYFKMILAGGRLHRLDAVRVTAAAHRYKVAAPPVAV